MNERSLRPSEALDKILLRVPEGMRERLKEAAEENKRSMNAEIIRRLGATLPDNGGQQFVVNFAPDLWNEVKLQAEYKDVLPEKIISGIVEDYIRGTTEDFSLPLHQAGDVVRENHELFSELIADTENREKDYAMYYSKLSQIKSLAKMVLSFSEEAISRDIRESMEDLLEQTDIELVIARRRFKVDLPQERERVEQCRPSGAVFSSVKMGLWGAGDDEPENP